ncbi:lipase, hormone-sensitive a [Poecilia latipinna]|uniref:Hormone-sensitive lipase n=2 Tax=Poecilia TaxID=8080 RepID=A0A087XJL9_POEFO|nr:PREDICTED: hormone-sensitive lipase-like [Poecilia formosa]XP_014887057.1 PREDICTED: hormone-sensitive lipase-like [Poecilia latipinna]
MRLDSEMDHSAVFTALDKVCEENICVLSGPSESPYGTVTKRLVACMRKIRQHGRALEPVVASFTAVYHHYDFDAQTPGNGYRTLVKVLQSCLVHIIHKGRYIASNCRGAFFRAEHNAAEMEAYCSALCQLRALLHLAQRLLHDNAHGELYSSQDADLSDRFVQEYSSMHKACFYGRCLGFQFSPALRPFLQTIVISMVSYGETYGRQQSGIGTAALSLLTSGKYVIDPELRGAEFERITQNLDLHFWKSFWNVTESDILSGFTRIASNPVQVNLTLTVPPESLQLPLASDPTLSTSVSPPVAHWGPGPVHMRLISYDLREGQDSEELLGFSQGDAAPIASPRLPWVQKKPPSPWLLIHFHGGGFVAQTSRSHENYLRNWSKELSVPVLSVDYSLSPEAPFPRALEECFYAYCWALKHCHLLGSTAERVCLAGDSAGGNLCITVCMRALTAGIRLPDGIMAAYPATLLTTDASPSRLLTLIDPLLPLGVLARCINAYAGSDFQTVQPAERRGSLSALGRDTALLLSDLTQGASNWIQSLLDPARTKPPPPHRGADPHRAPGPAATAGAADILHYPDGFEPLRSECHAYVLPTSCAVIRNPFVSPLLAPTGLLKGLPPVHLVASALDALLDDSVMFAKKLRAMGQAVTLTVVDDLPHGFLSLAQICKETQFASDICVSRIRTVFQPPPQT